MIEIFLLLRYTVPLSIWCFYHIHHYGENCMLVDITPKKNCLYCTTRNIYLVYYFREQLVYYVTLCKIPGRWDNPTQSWRIPYTIHRWHVGTSPPVTGKMLTYIHCTVRTAFMNVLLHKKTLRIWNSTHKICKCKKRRRMATLWISFLRRVAIQHSLVFAEDNLYEVQYTAVNLILKLYLLRAHKVF